MTAAGLLTGEEVYGLAMRYKEGWIHYCNLVVELQRWKGEKAIGVAEAAASRFFFFQSS
jgi:hypothetical protein